MAKKKNKVNIDALIADNKWEQVQRERDSVKTEKIKKLGERSKIDVLIGGLLVFAAYSSILDVIKAAKKSAKVAGADNVAKGAGSNEWGLIIALAVVGLAFFYLALSKYETIDKLTAARYVWMPDKAETDFIEKRFDNGFVKSILSKISPVDTHSIEVGLEAVRVNNNGESSEFNYNRSGFNRPSNYDTKQLAFYLASHSFPDGFSIYQTKITAAGAEKFIGGTTEVGSDRPPKEDEATHAKRLYARLYEQLREFVRIKNPFAVYLKEPGPSAANNGQIVLNKGFRPDKEGYTNI